MEETTKRPQYVVVAQRAEQTIGDSFKWLQTEGWKFLLISAILTDALIGLTLVLQVQLGSGLFTLLCAASTILFMRSLWIARLMIKADYEGQEIEQGKRILVFSNIASSAVAIVATSAIYIMTGFSFMNTEIEPWAVQSSVGGIGTKVKSVKPVKTVKQIGNNDGIQEFIEIPNTVENIDEGGPRTIRVPLSKTSSSSANEKEIQYRFFLRNFMEREGFSPKRYWDKSQWSIGFGSRSHAKDNRTLTREQAYKEAQAELEECRAKAKKDFPWLSYEQELVVMDLYYNAGKSSITGLKGVKAEGEALYELKKFAKNPKSITLNDLYAAFVADKSCGDCEKGKKCGHKERKLRNAIQFLSNRSDNDKKIFLTKYSELISKTSSLVIR